MVLAPQPVPTHLRQWKVSPLAPVRADADIKFREPRTAASQIHSAHMARGFRDDDDILATWSIDEMQRAAEVDEAVRTALDAWVPLRRETDGFRFFDAISSLVIAQISEAALQRKPKAYREEREARAALRAAMVAHVPLPEPPAAPPAPPPPPAPPAAPQRTKHERSGDDLASTSSGKRRRKS